MKAILVFSLLAAFSTARAEPLKLLPANPRYFEFRGKPAVLVGSGEHYGAMVNLDFDYVRYLDTLAADGLNLTRTFSGAYIEPPGAFKIQNNTLAPAPGKFLAPWLRSEQAGGNKFDLTKWDDAYFARLRDFLAQADRRGIVVELTLFSPMYEEPQWKVSPMNAANNVNGIGKVDAHRVHTLDAEPALLQVQEALVRKIAAELNGFDNLYYEVCNEPYFGGVTQAWHDRITDVIVDSERGLPKQHLISWNFANGSKAVANPHPAISIFNFHYANPPDAVAQNAALNKPIGENETGFKGTGDAHYRMEAWEFLLAGGALFNHLDYSFTTEHEDGTAQVVDPTPGGGGPALRKAFGFLKSFIEKFELAQLRPAPKLIVKGAPEHWRALAEGTDRYAVYCNGAAPAEIHFALKDGRWRERWSDVNSGMLLLEQTVEARDGLAVLKLPECCGEVALELRFEPR